MDLFNYLQDKIDLDNIQLIEFIKFNSIIYIENCEYVHYPSTSSLWINVHLLKYNNNTYFCNYFTSDYINNTIINNKSKDIIKMKEIKRNNIINIDNGFILYTSTNSAGHELCSILNGIYIHKINNLPDFDIIISDQILKFGKFLESVLYLFYPKNRIHFVNYLDKVIIKNTYIYSPISYKETTHISFLNNELKLHYNNVKNYKKICILKTNLTKHLNTIHSAFDIEYINYFKNKDFEIIFAENYSIIELYNIINNSDYIILSWGCNAWINSIFINENSNVMILCNINYKHEYYNPNYQYNSKILSLWTPICNKLIMVFDLPNILDDVIISKLDNSIKELYTN
jgi:hypothetical protein